MMKKEISPALVVAVIVVVVIIVGAYFAVHLFSGPKIISGTPPPTVHMGPPPTPPGFQYGGQNSKPPLR
ncbi:MAG TPA: hypothetical protein VKV18_01370 [Chthonomonas sp.]|uniref:hypothetical protein n=1 Tax=Chthonomonas sp. TaxID=2282153 RepID=UPI002B4B6B63|nr:hypothetical protein [Chthonomonas sp.]HLI47327.1 hypothetical protein [Chthonomonas sp.]